jgi:DNA uptake protein ComE-like DNA-binding protein
VLPTVLVIMTIALLVGTGMLFLTQAEASGMAASRQLAQSRLTAWSGVQAAMNGLHAQRRALLESRVPSLDDQYVLYDLDDRLGVARLLPLNAAGDRVLPENIKLDLNAATAEMLAATGLIDEQLARAVIAFRDGPARGAFQSEADLLRVPGMTSEILYGAPEALRTEVAAGNGSDTEARTRGSMLDRVPSALADVVTVYGYEPALQRSGKLRINVNVPWSDELGRRIAQRWDEGAAQLLKQIFDNGTTFDSEAKFFQVLRSFGVDPAEWPDVIDALTSDSTQYHFGRVNINYAPHEVLAALPGLNDELAAQLVQARDSLTDEERNTVCWPAIEQIVPPEAYDLLAGRITTRSWTFRVRIAAGEVNADEPEGPLEHAVVYEAVIDLAAPRARVAYLRDVTMMDVAVALAAQALEDDEAGAADDGEPADAGDALSQGPGATGDERELGQSPRGRPGELGKQGSRTSGALSPSIDEAESEGDSVGRSPQDHDVEADTADTPESATGVTQPTQSLQRIGRWRFRPAAP